MPTPKTVEVIAHMFNELRAPYKELTVWELSFLQSISNQFDTRGSLTDKQFETLERIYTEKTA